MSVLLFTEGVIILFFAVVQLLARNKQPIHYSMFAVCLALGYLLMYSWVTMSGMILRFPLLIGSDIPLNFLAAPAFYLTSLTILHGGRRPVRRYAVYFIAPALLALGSGLYIAFTVPAYLRKFGTIPGRFSTVGMTILNLLAVLSMVAAICLDLRMAHRLYKSGLVKHKSEFLIQVVFLFCYLASTSVAVVSVILLNDRLFTMGYVIAGLIAVLFAFSRTTALYFAEGYAIPIRHTFAKPEWDSSAAELTARITRVMETDAPYRDADLSLQKLAHALGTESKRLSYHLHANLSLSFRSYINEWRLEAVCRDLLEHPDRSILDIAFDNGFNSKSSFNTLFFKKYGMTPRDYRKK